jgi:DNA processing protein
MSGVLDAAARVAAEGTDPDLLARLVAWACRPRHELDALRRRVRDAPDPAERARGPQGAATLLARLAGPPPSWLDDATLRVLGLWEGLGVRAAVVGDPAYPVRLAEGWPVTDGPTVLTWRGSRPTDAGPGVAIVGARAATRYGLEVAAWLAAEIARAGGRVVSGGAVGVDAAAHRAALGLPGGTTVVLGCGHAVPYPAAHARRGGLFDRVLEDGGTLLCELLPEVRPHPGVIRGRNRILAGLAEVTVVVEGGSRSGALLTAGAAAERGRAVLAVPGDVRAPGSAAPLRLLAEGAEPCGSPADVLAHLPRLTTPIVRTSRPLPERAHAGADADEDEDEDAETVAGGGLDPRILRLLARAWPRPVVLDELVHTSGVAAAPLLAMLMRARIAGGIEDVDGGVRLRRGGRSVEGR